MKLALTLLSLVFVAALVGCADKKPATAAVTPAVTDIAPPAPPSYQPTQAAATQTPITDTYTTATPTAGASVQTASVSGNKYTVKKGDTLYSIAKSRYGDGKQWQKIAQANPGVSPQSLKVGQTLTMPN